MEFGKGIVAWSEEVLVTGYSLDRAIINENAAWEFGPPQAPRVMELRQVLLMMSALVGVVKHVDGQPIQRAHMIRLEMDYLEQ